MRAASDPVAEIVAAPQNLVERDPVPQSFAEVVALFDAHREALIRSHLWSDVHLVQFEPGRIELRPAAGAPRDLANRLGQLLSEWTGMRWLIAVSEAAGEPAAPAGRARDRTCERGGQPPVGSGGARDLSGGDDRRGPGALRDGRGRGGRASRTSRG